MKTAVNNYIGSLNWGYRVSLRDKNVNYVNAYAEFVEPHKIKVSVLLILNSWMRLTQPLRLIVFFFFFKHAFKACPASVLDKLAPSCCSFCLKTKTVSLLLLITRYVHDIRSSRFQDFCVEVLLMLCFDKLSGCSDFTR